jgi:hypothetical protein
VGGVELAHWVPPASRCPDLPGQSVNGQPNGLRMLESSCICGQRNGFELEFD